MTDISFCFVFFFFLFFSFFFSMASVTKLHDVLYPVTEFQLYETIDSGTIIQLLIYDIYKGKSDSKVLKQANRLFGNR